MHEMLGKERTSVRDIAGSTPEDMLPYQVLILGIPTWGIGEPQEDWLGFIPKLETLDLTGRYAALFGLGDQESYPETFADALGWLYDSVVGTGCRIVGSWPVDGYEFIGSAAIREGKFAGLVLDEENQSEQTGTRIQKWISEISPLINGHLKA